MIPYGRQQISVEDIDAVAQVLKSDFLTQGPAVPAFEEVIATYCNVAHAIAVNSATSALHIACLALGVGAGDHVWTSPNTFVASANCARYCGASIDFVDIDPKTYNLCPSKLGEKLARAKRDGKLPKVVIPVHFAGLPCDMAAIHALSKEYGFAIIEDASHAIGATQNGHRVGHCEYSDVTVFSFHPVKIITTGEGGMATTQSPSLAKRMRLLRSHGITREATDFTGSEDAPWYYEQQSLGFNYRMTDIQAALGSSQARRLSSWIDQRHQLAAVYDSALSPLPLVTPVHQDNNSRSALHLYVVQLDPERTNLDRKTAFTQLRQAGIGVNVHYIPAHLQPDFVQFGFHQGDFPTCEAYYGQCISLPMHAGLTPDQQAHVIASVRTLFA